ncbi:MAG TPA: GHKL domain-containing protein [Candidatus Eisenbergiella merdavium]|uniref:GHKL domain-containing protein n=1 Tax=Candidatus Eisenbergiella merdavium TaxID=2838551 RepID=A0A9D2ND32_9FIRM|nr:GHKL domain-containing protein [Candidatus Eisenbergiella merdavium]
MYEVGKGILNGVLLLATIWIVNKYLNCLFVKKKWSFFSALVWIYFVIFQAIVEFRDKYGNIWITVTVLVVTYLIAMLCFEKAGLKKFIYITFLYVAWSAVEVIVIGIFENIQISARMKYDFGEVMSKIIMVFLIQIVALVVEKDSKNNIPLKYNIFLLFIPLGSMFILANEFFFSAQKENVIFSLLLYSVVLLINIQVFEVYLKLIRFFDAENEKVVFEQQFIQMSNRINEQNKIVDDFYEKQHNIANELIIVREYIESNDNRNAKKTLENILKFKEEGVLISKCGNRIVDAIINFKYATIKNLGISFSLKITIPEEMSVDECDMGIILGNAIDNAIEATEMCVNLEKKITILMGVKKGTLIIIIKNPYENELKKSKSGDFLSTKHNSKGHGFGLGAIKKVADKYSGDVLIETQNNIFGITILLDLEELCQ